MSDRHITPGEQATASPEEVLPFVKENWDISAGPGQIWEVQEQQSHTGRIFHIGSAATQESAAIPSEHMAMAEPATASSERFVLEMYPDSISYNQVHLAHGLSNFLNTAEIRIDGNDRPVRVQSYLPTASSHSENQSEVVAWYGNELSATGNPATLARFIPGEKLGSDASLAATNRIAELQAKIHNHFQNHELLRLLGDDSRLEIRSTDGYMDLFTRQTPEIIAQTPETWQIALDSFDAAFWKLRKGVVPTSLWMADVICQDEWPKAIGNLKETTYTTPLLCYGMGSWGAYTVKENVEAVTQYEETYKRHRVLSPEEKELLPLATIVRGVMCWQGAKLVEHRTAPGEISAAQRDEECLENLLDYYLTRNSITL